MGKKTWSRHQLKSVEIGMQLELFWHAHGLMTSKRSSLRHLELGPHPPAKGKIAIDYQAVKVYSFRVFDHLLMSWNRGTATLEPSHHGTALLVTAASLANERDDLELFNPCLTPPETSMTMENPPFEDVLYLKFLCWTWGLSNVILVIRGVYFYATVDSTVGHCPILRVFVGTVCSICVVIFSD